MRKGQTSLLIVMVILSVITISTLIRAEVVINEPSNQTKSIDYEKYLKIESAKNSYAFYDVPLTLTQQKEVQKLCEKYNIPYEIVLGIMKIESNFNVDAQNGDCIGIMQVNTINKIEYEKEWKELGIRELNKFYQGIEAGCFVFSKCKGETIEEKLIAYNEGNNGYMALKNKGITSTEYSRKVLEYAMNL